jgi:hypothetical protein
MQAKVTLKSDLFASLRLLRDVKVPNFLPARASASGGAAKAPTPAKV